MPRAGRRSRQPLLTEVELELMQHVWARGGATVRDVLRDLPEGRELAYTSVSTILRILVDKGVLESRKEGRSHVYVPKLSRDEYERRSVRHLVQSVFQGEPRALVRRLLDPDALTPEDVDEIRALLKTRSRGDAAKEDRS